MAIKATFFPSAGILSEVGDGVDNTIVTSRDAAGQLFVNGGAVPINGGQATVTNTSTIQVFGQGGNDTIALDESNGALPAAQLFGGAGNDTLTGGVGADLYQTGRGGGADQISAALNDGSADQLAFTGDVDHDQLWFSRSNQDLVISIIGTNDSMTVKGWYTAGNDQLNQIVSGDGDYLSGGDVQSLVAAMASLTPPPIGQTKLSTQQQQTLSPMLAAAWHPS
jgi:hypothetical protein